MTMNDKKPLIEFKWVTSFIVMIGIFMGLLDTTIVNIVLPKMIASLNTDTYGVQWVVISYLIGSAIAMTSVGWLGATIGHRNTYILGAIVFTILSVFCGQAKSIEMMNVCRFLQGIGEGIIVPIGMTMLFEVFPEEERGLAMGIYCLGASFAPALGPTLGGYITEHLNWRWIFYINLPIGLITIALSMFFLKETKPDDEKTWPFDTTGFILMAIAFGSFIAFLSKGQEKGWMQSDLIMWMIVIFAVSFPLFLLVEIKSEHPLIDLSIFKHRNYTFSFLALTFFSITLYAIFFLGPMFLERLKQFPTLTAGLILLPGALTSSVAVIASGILCDKINPKMILLAALFFLIFATFNLGLIDINTTKEIFRWKYIYWGSVMSAVFPPATVIGLAILPQHKVGMGSCLQNVTRLLFGSVGTALATTILERRADKYFESFGNYLNPGNITATTTINKLMGYLHYHGTPELLLKKKALKLLCLHLEQVSYSYAFQAAICWMSVFVAIGFVFAIFIKSTKETQGAGLSIH